MMCKSTKNHVPFVLKDWQVGPPPPAPSIGLSVFSPSNFNVGSSFLSPLKMKGKGLCNASALYMSHLISWLPNYTVFVFGPSNAKPFFLGGGGVVLDLIFQGYLRV